MPNPRLTQQIAFLVEADRLKHVLRRTPVMDASRLENSAEHSWHLALTAIVLTEYAPTQLDVLRVLELVTVHDLVEIDAGDTFAYDVTANQTKADREVTAADRIFGLLATDQATRIRELWDEFEQQQTPEARFAHAVDRLQPLLQNMQSGGGSWKTHGVTRDDVLRRMAPLQTELPDVWPFVLEVIERFFPSNV
jgi:putative hydrolase of HD superfamily